MGLTVNEVENFLLAHAQGKISDLMPIGHGEWSQAFSFKDGPAEKVIRFGKYQDDYLKDQFAAGFRSASLPVPIIEEVGLAYGGYFAVSQKINGKMIDELDHGAMQKLFPKLLNLLSAA